MTRKTSPAAAAAITDDSAELMRALRTPPKVSWPAVAIMIGANLTIAVASTLAVMAIIPLWAGAIINTLAIYALFTPAHESMHRSASSNPKLNEWIMYLSTFFAVPFGTGRFMRVMHMQHHRFTNEENDPDHFLSSHFLLLPIWGFWPFLYLWTYARNPEKYPGIDGRATWIEVIRGLAIVAVLFVSPLCALGSALFAFRAVHHLALVRVVDRRQADVLARDVLPDVELGPVADGEHAEMLARLQTGVEQRPELGALGLGLPLAEAVAVRKDALLGAGLFFVAARTADQRVEAEFFDGFEQRDRLVHVAAFARVGQAHGAALHRVLDVAHDQFGLQLGGAAVAEVGHFGEVVAGVDHQQRVGDAADTKGFFGAAQHHQRILAAREQQGGALESRGHFAQDEDGFFFERVQVGVAQVVVTGVLQGGLDHGGFGAGVHEGVRSMDDTREDVAGCTCRPHSLALSCSHHQRPARKSSPTLMARVQGSQPMLGKNRSCSGL